MRAAGYVRVSTSKQVDGLSLDEQQRRLQERAIREGWDLVEFFVESGVSGRKERRPELDRMMGRLGDFDVVMIPKIDRLGRNARRLREMKDALEDAGVKLFCLSPEIDFDSMAGRIVWAVLIEQAQAESETLGERVSAISEARARQGRHAPGTAPYGYKRDKERGLAPHPSEAGHLVRMFELSEQGNPHLWIARRFNEEGVPTRSGRPWSDSVISSILRNPVYAGRVRLKGREYPGAHEPLVDPMLWERVAQAAAARRKSPGAGRGRLPKGGHLFVRGLLKCAHCGETMIPRTQPGERGDVYECQGRKLFGLEHCPQTPIPRAVIDAAAFEYFREVGLDIDATARQLENAAQGQITRLASLREDSQTELAELNHKLARIDEDYLERRIEASDMRRLRAETLTRIEAEQARVELLSTRLDALLDSSDADSAREQVLARIAELRAAVAGEVGSAEGISAVRGALARLFERFDVGRLDVPQDPGVAGFRDKIEVDVAAGCCWVILPWPRAEAVESLGDEWRPVLTREALLLEENPPSGTRRSVSWLPFYA